MQRMILAVWVLQHRIVVLVYVRVTVREPKLCLISVSQVGRLSWLLCKCLVERCA